jgi:hypothetical protein
MSEDSVYGSQEFTEYEWQLVDKIKKTMKFLAKAIKHRDPQAVKKDIDPHGEMEEEELAELVKKHLTPDLPELNANEEAVVIGQLGPVVFAELMALEREKPHNPDDEPN